MISGSAALSASNTTTGSLSYFNSLFTGATSQGPYERINGKRIKKCIWLYGYR